MEIIVHHDAEIEHDTDRGVLYVHAKEWGGTAIRICGLPKEFRLKPGGLLDINMTQFHRGGEDETITKRQ